MIFQLLPTAFSQDWTKGRSPCALIFAARQVWGCGVCMSSWCQFFDQSLSGARVPRLVARHRLRGATRVCPGERTPCLLSSPAILSRRHYNNPMKNAAMLWTGGKDSAMALFEATKNGYDVRCLVTFAPPEPDFLAHPLSFLKIQARALNLAHYVLPITAPFDSGYETSLQKMRGEMGISCVVTGDIAEVNGNPNWVCERSRVVGMDVYMPLWGRDRNVLLGQLLDRGFKAHFSCVSTRWLNVDWIGRELTDSAIADLRVIREQIGLDLCGEEGEYHTLVVDGSQFTQSIEIRSFSTHATDTLAYMKIHESNLFDHVV